MTTPTTPTSDTQAALDYVTARDLFHKDISTDMSMADEIKVVAVPAGHTLTPIDVEHLAPFPRRSRGDIFTHTAEGFTTAVSRRVVTENSGWNIYADLDSLKLVAILNDDDVDLPGWRDHRVILSLRPTAEWKTWDQNQGLHSQEKFAEIIDLGIKDIVEPAAADMLTLAETFEATVNVRFQQGANMQNGQRQLVFDETIDARAGKGGSLVIPDRFAIGLRLFVGGPAYRVEAKLKYRLRDGNLTIGYTLDRPDDVVRAAFTDIVQSVAAGLAHTAIEGVAPPPRS